MKKGLFKKLAAVLLSETMIFTAVPASVSATDSLKNAEADAAAGDETELLQEGSDTDENFNLPEEEAVKVYPETEEIITDEYFYEESSYDSILWTGSIQVGSSISLTFSRAIEFEDYSDDVVTVTGALSEDGTKTTFIITGNSVGSAVVPVNSSYELNLTVTGFDLSSYEIAESSDAVAAMVREGIKNRDEEITVYVFNPKNNLGTPSSVMPQVYAHTGEGNEGDYIKYGSYTHAQYSTSTVMDNSSGYNRIVISDDGASWLLKYTYTFTYYDDASQEEELTAALDDIMTELNLDSLPDDYSRVKVIYDYICENVTYDYTNLNDEDYLLKYSAYAALINGTSVCNGYAALFYRMACMAGLDARIIAGQATSSMENHAWNIVKLEDQYYYLDATWDAGDVNYSWFLRGTSSFAEHYAFSEFSEDGFTANYPIAEENYIYIPAEEDDTVWSDPVWNWEVDGTAAATFTSVNDKTVTKTIDADVDIEETEDGYVYTASVEFNGTTYTDTRIHTHSFGDWQKDYPNGIYRECECGATEELTTDLTDLTNNNFYIPIVWAVNEGITSGKTVTTFDQNGACTRGQVAAFLWRAAGCPEPETTENPFTDVKESSAFDKAILWAYENGITSGKTATTFAPSAVCTREQIVTFMWRAAGSPEPETTENPFKDITSSRKTYKAILWAVENGITSGKTAATFDPTGTCTRGQIVTFIYRASVKGII